VLVSGSYGYNEPDRLMLNRRGSEAYPWTNLGQPLAGAAGDPLLVGQGTLVAGSSGQLELAQAAASAPAWLLVAAHGAPTPFKGGVLVPVPILLSLTVATDSTGGHVLPWAAFPPGLPGIELFLQAAILDPTAVAGVALSNAGEGRAPMSASPSISPGNRLKALVVIGALAGSLASPAAAQHAKLLFREPCFAVGSQPRAIATGDFDGDGRPDLASASWAGASVDILLGRGAGLFLSGGSIAVGGKPNALVVADFDGDGRQDLAVSNEQAVVVLLGDGAGGFVAGAPVAAGPGPTSLAGGDFNHDGHPTWSSATPTPSRSSCSAAWATAASSRASRS
jgi:hypothetical protein